jgi:DNA-directed RNA polymerase specialized sigma24 family protein
MAAEVRIEQHMGLLKKFAGQVTKRLMAMGSTTKYDDVLSECCIAWCMARDSWESERGVPFVAFLVRGMRNHVNQFANKEIFHHNGSHLDLDAPSDGFEDSEGHEFIADRDAEDPEDTVILADRREKALKRLSPRARQFVELLESPPKCLVEIVSAMAARREFAIERGISSPATPRRVLPGLIFRFMGASRVEQTRISKEIEDKFNVREALAAMDRV